MAMFLLPALSLTAGDSFSRDSLNSHMNLSLLMYHGCKQIGGP